MHKQFEVHHSHGEWYNECEEILKFIEHGCIRCSKCAEIIDDEIQQGNISWKVALQLSGDDILEIQRNRVSKVFEKALANIDTPELGKQLINPPLNSKHIELFKKVTCERPRFVLKEFAAHKDRL